MSQTPPPGWPPPPQPHPMNYPYPNPYPPAPPPRNHNRLVLFLVLGICVGLLVCAGLGATTVLVLRHKTSTATGSGTQGGGHQADLRTYLVPAPAGSTPWQHPLGTDEHLSLDQEAQLAVDDTPAQRAQQLRDQQFQEGAVRTWRASNDDVVEVRLLRFATADLAEGLYQDDATAGMTQYGTANVQPVLGVEESVLFTDPAVDTNGYLHLYGFARKKDVVMIVVIGEHASLPERDRGHQLVKQQYDRL